jgi:hypothetical protein
LSLYAPVADGKDINIKPDTQVFVWYIRNARKFPLAVFTIEKKIYPLLHLDISYYPAAKVLDQ